MKRARTAVLLLALVCAAAMTGCAEKRIPWKDAYDAAALTWDAAIYDSENGRISFVYESGADEIEAVEDTDRVSIYCGERCTVVIDYYEGVQELDEMEAELRGTYRDTMGSTLSEKTEKLRVTEAVISPYPAISERAACISATRRPVICPCITWQPPAAAQRRSSIWRIS